MTGTLVEIRHNKSESQRNLKLDKGSKDAMADYWRHRWPSNTAKYGAREFGLTLDQARSVVAGRASLSTLDQIEKAGGWPVIFAVKAMVLGKGADQFLIETRNAHEENGRRLSTLVSNWLPVGPDRPADRAHDGHALDGRDWPVADRRSRQQG